MTCYKCGKQIIGFMRICNGEYFCRDCYGQVTVVDEEYECGYEGIIISLFATCVAITIIVLAAVITANIMELFP